MSEFSIAGLRALREVAERGSFTAAADALGYTQSAVSRQVAGLEAAAGAPLFDRAARGSLLTDAGTTLLRHAVGVIDQLDAAQRELEGLQTLATGRLRVGAFATAVASLLPRAMAAFRAQHGAIDVSLREGMSPAQLRRVASGATDLAVVGRLPGQPLDDRGLVLEALLDDPLLIAVARAHPLARQRTVDLDELAGERWIITSTSAGDPFHTLWDSVAWQPQVAFVAREWTAKLGLAAAGLGLTLVPGLAATAARDDVALVRIRSERPAVRTVSLATRADSALPAYARAFADALHEVAAELAVGLQQRIAAR
jgi:DNA-binding transcriptional LysR family regulator